MINNVTLIGRLTATPELRQTTTGKTVVSFCIAVERRFDRATSDFINVVAWNKTAEFVNKYFAFFIILFYILSGAENPSRSIHVSITRIVNESSAI